MAELTDPNQPSFEDEVHDLLLANYIQSRRILDLLYITLRVSKPTFADDLLASHERGEYIYPDVFPEVEEDKE